MIYKNNIPQFNPYEHQEIISALVNGTCIFLGAGVSKLAGYPLWYELKNSLIMEFWNQREQIEDWKVRFNFNIKEALEKKDNIESISYLYNISKDLFKNILQKIFEKCKKESTPEIYQEFSNLALANNTQNFIIQTNIDKGLEETLGIQDTQIAINPNFGIKKKLTYIHGRVDKPESWVFTQKNYNDAYLEKNSNLMDFLENIFINYNVIFFGCSLTDTEILQTIARANNNGSTKKHFSFESVTIDCKSKFMIKKTNLSNTYNISLIPYFIDYNGYEHLSDVLKSLSDVVVSELLKIKSPLVEKSKERAYVE